MLRMNRLSHSHLQSGRSCLLQGSLFFEDLECTYRILSRSPLLCELVHACPECHKREMTTIHTYHKFEHKSEKNKPFMVDLWLVTLASPETQIFWQIFI